MSSIPESTPTPSANFTKPLWVAVGVLTAAVLAKGGGLIYTQIRPAAPQAQAALPRAGRGDRTCRCDGAASHGECR